MNSSKKESRKVTLDGLRLRFLIPAQVKRIDDMLAQLGEYGELHLIIQRGELRYINRVESIKAWKGDEQP